MSILAEADPLFSSETLLWFCQFSVTGVNTYEIKNIYKTCHLKKQFKKKLMKGGMLVSKTLCGTYFLKTFYDYILKFIIIMYNIFYIG